MSIVQIVPLVDATGEAIIHIGAWSTRTACTLDLDEGHLDLSTSIMSQAGLEPGDTINVEVHDAGRHLHLGPLVGMLLGRNVEAQLHGHWRERYRQIIREARAIGALLFFCGVADIDSQLGNVKGWIERDGQWKATTFPVPDVMYHRATFSDPEKRRNAAGIMRELRDRHGMLMLNSVNAFSKLQVRDALHFFSETRHLSPETAPFDAMETLNDMLERHSCIFLKADQGSHGSDVLRVRLRDTWQVRGKVSGKQVNEAFESREHVETFLDQLKSQTNWAIQQGIDLPQVDERVFDMRVVLQKDGRGEWVVPLVLVRHAQRGSVATNMSQGGDPHLAPAFLQRFGKELPGLENMADAAAAAALRVAEALESSFGMLGEIGVDIGVDQTGRPWVFEANTKPLHPPIPDLPQPLTRFPFHYAAYLASRAWRGRYTGSACGAL